MSEQTDPLDAIEQSLRLDRLERWALNTGVFAALVMLLAGWLAPWYEERVSSTRYTERLVSVWWEAFHPHAGEQTDAIGTVLGVCFVFLDVMTVVAVVMLLTMAYRSLRSVLVARIVAVLLLCCLAGALGLSLVAVVSPSATLHPSAILLWGLGVLVTALLALNGDLREWWLRRP